MESPTGVVLYVAPRSPAYCEPSADSRHSSEEGLTIGADQRALRLQGAHASSDREPGSASPWGSAGLPECDREAARGRNHARSRLPEDSVGAVVLSACEAKTGRLGACTQRGCKYGIAMDRVTNEGRIDFTVKRRCGNGPVALPHLRALLLVAHPGADDPYQRT